MQTKSSGGSLIRSAVLPAGCTATESLSVGDDDVPDPFSDVTAAPPDWLFSRDWDVVRLTVRGTDERDESLSVRLDTDAGVLILR